MTITLQKNRTSAGDTVSILKDGDPVALLRQIGSKHPDTRLEWLTWDNDDPIAHAIQFPCCHPYDITPDDAQRLYVKYLTANTPA